MEEEEVAREGGREAVKGEKFVCDCGEGFPTKTARRNHRRRECKVTARRLN
jgi:hypothetical protein